MSRSVFSHPVRERHSLAAMVVVRIMSDKTSEADYISSVEHDLR